GEAAAARPAQAARVALRGPSADLDGRVLPQVLQMLLGENLEFLLAQLRLRVLAHRGLGLAPAQRPELDAGLADARRQEVAVPGIEQQAPRGLRNRGRLARPEVLVLRAGRCGERGQGRTAGILARERVGLRDALRDDRLIDCTRQRQRDPLDLQLEIARHCHARVGDEGVDVALGDRDEMAETPPYDLAPRHLRAEARLHRVDVDAHALHVLTELLERHLVALGDAREDARDLLLVRNRVEPLGLLQLELFLDQLLARLALRSG